jgi:hypothetical protein
MSYIGQYSRYFNVKTIALFIAVLSAVFFIENKSILPTHTSQVVVYFLDLIPKHTLRTIGGVKNISPSAWSAHVMIEGKSVICDISSSVYATLKAESNEKRLGLLSYHHALFSDEMVCEQLEPIISQK